MEIMYHVRNSTMVTKIEIVKRTKEPLSIMIMALCNVTYINKITILINILSCDSFSENKNYTRSS